MSRFLFSSIGKKFIMGISGLFLILFLLLHLIINSLILIPDGGITFNKAAHFMVTNPFIGVMEPILAIGFIVHITYGIILTLQNKKARGRDRYASGNKTINVTWASKNMLILGFTILAFLVLHIANFWVKMRITGDPALDEVIVNIAGVDTVVNNSYRLVNETFGILWIVVVYIIAGVLLALHLSHGFWSSFQSVGFSNDLWRKRLTIIGNIYAWGVSLGFSLIALLQYLFYQG